MKKQAEQAQQERNKIIGIPSLVVAQVVRQFLLVADARFIEKVDAADPVAGSGVPCVQTLFAVLPAGEVPHEVPPIHPTQLVFPEEFKVVAKSRFAGRFVDPAAVELRAPLRIVAHTREQGFAGRRVVVVDLFIHDFIPVADTAPTLFGDDADGFGIEARPAEQGAFAVLFAVEVRKHPRGVGRVVHIDRRVGISPDHHHSESHVGYNGHAKRHCQALQQAVARAFRPA